MHVVIIFTSSPYHMVCDYKHGIVFPLQFFYAKYFCTGHTTQCLKIHTIEELAKYQQMYPELNTDCSNHISTSNLIVRSLCPSVPVTQNWKPGVKVILSCHRHKKIRQKSCTFPLFSSTERF